MKKGFLLSKDTALAVRELLNREDGAIVGKKHGEFKTRITGFVICGSEISSGKYNGTIQVYNVDTSSWETGEDCILIPPPAGGTKLLSGRGYIALRYGVEYDKSLWAVAYGQLQCQEFVTGITCYDGTITVEKKCVQFYGELDADCCEGFEAMSEVSDCCDTEYCCGSCGCCEQNCCTSIQGRDFCAAPGAETIGTESWSWYIDGSGFYWWIHHDTATGLAEYIRYVPALCQEDGTWGNPIIDAGSANILIDGVGTGIERQYRAAVVSQDAYGCMDELTDLGDFIDACGPMGCGTTTPPVPDIIFTCT